MADKKKPHIEYGDPLINDARGAVEEVWHDLCDVANIYRLAEEAIFDNLIPSEHAEAASVIQGAIASANRTLRTLTITLREAADVLNNEEGLA